MSHRGQVLIALVLAALVAVPASVVAQGIGAVPSRIQIDDALRGSTLFRSFALNHTFDDTVTFELSFEGDAAPWFSVVTPDDREAPLQTVEVPVEELVELELRIDIPDDTPNGTYEGQLIAITSPEQSGEQIDVATGVIIPVRIDVTGTQELRGEITVVAYRNAEAGQELPLTVTVRNDGNVRLDPVLTARVERDGQLIAEITSPEDEFAVFPGEERSYDLRWDTTDERTGVYDVTVTGTANGIDLGTDTGRVEVFARGVFTREGRLDSLELTNQPVPGGAARLAATVINTGAIESRVFFIGELYRDGELVAPVESAERFLRADETGVIQFIVETPVDGVYRVEGVVNFEGTDSNQLAVEFTVGEPSGGGGANAGLIAGVVGGAVLLGGLGWVVSRRKVG